MSRDTKMFSLMAEEIDRIADRGEKMDENDMFVALSAMNKLVVDGYFRDELACCAIALAACRFGGMEEVLDELPDIEDEMLDLLLKKRGFKRYESDGLLTAYIQVEG